MAFSDFQAIAPLSGVVRQGSHSQLKVGFGNSLAAARKVRGDVLPEVCCLIERQMGRLLPYLRRSEV